MEKKRTPEEVKALGKKFLDELRAKGPTLDRVGQSVVRVGGIKSETNDENHEEPLSKARQLQRLRVDLANELRELDELIEKEKNNPNPENKS